MQSPVGIVGLGVMGANLARNIASHGFAVAGFDSDPAKQAAFAQATRFSTAPDIISLASSLARPRRLLLLVPAGDAVDRVIDSLRPILQPGDLLADAGNTHFADTERRCKELCEAGIHFMGIGVSGGEKGALAGPAIMAGGSTEAWESIGPVLEAIAAKAHDGTPCVARVGPGGAGHYVKMVHNAIEYADMQLIAEVWDLLNAAGLTAADAADLFESWNHGDLQSYLLEITAIVLRKIDADTGRPLVEMILDEAAQKGTGQWASLEALKLGVAMPTIHAAVEARVMSGKRGQPRRAARQVPHSLELVDATRGAFLAARVAALGQGMALLQASEAYGYGLDIGRIAEIWRAGCIIRSQLLNGIRSAYRAAPRLPHLFEDPVMRAHIAKSDEGWRVVVNAGIACGVPLPALSSALAYVDTYQAARLPANLIQAQRDYFGAHTYRRTDRPGVFHTNWDS